MALIYHSCVETGVYVHFTFQMIETILHPCNEPCASQDGIGKKYLMVKREKAIPP